MPLLCFLTAAQSCLFFNTYEPTVYKIPDLHICFFTQYEDSLTAGTSNFLSSQTRWLIRFLAQRRTLVGAEGKSDFIYQVFLETHTWQNQPILCTYSNVHTSHTSLLAVLEMELRVGLWLYAEPSNNNKTWHFLQMLCAKCFSKCFTCINSLNSHPMR